MTVTPRFEVSEEEHQLRDFQIIEVLNDEVCEFLRLIRRYLVLHAAELREIAELIGKPFLRRKTPERRVYLREIRGVPEHARIGVGGEVRLLIDVILIQKARPRHFLQSRNRGTYGRLLRNQRASLPYLIQCLLYFHFL